MSDVWGEDVTRGWLPDDEQSEPCIMQSIRDFLAYRATVPQDVVALDLRDMKGLFSALSLDDAEAKESKSNSTTGTDSDQLDFLASSSSVHGEGPFGSFDSSPDVQNWT